MTPDDAKRALQIYGPDVATLQGKTVKKQNHGIPNHQAIQIPAPIIAQYNNVRLSIHAGEVDEPNYHVRDSLLLGADRIGHGVNLITDPDTMRLMRHGPYMVEINLVSNLLLEYIDDYSQHPFPEYLRTGIPVALSTDDRGMWDSTMTDEFFVAVKEFNLSWAEIKMLGENSLRFSFAPDEVKADLLETYRSRIGKFEKRAAARGLESLKGEPAPKRHFICQRYELCDQ